jgi:hypothetical protein
MSNPRDFGAAGDGRTDDTAALQHALNDGDGLLELERKTYRISRPLELDLAQRGPMAVRGAGGASRIVMAGPGPALLVTGDHQGTAAPPSVRPSTWEKERLPNIAGLEIVGDHPEADGIRLVRTMQPTITGVLIRRCRTALHLFDRNRNLLLADCHLYDNTHYGVFFDRCNLHQANIQGCHISYNAKAGIYSLHGDVHNVQITGCDIEYNNPRSVTGAKAPDLPPDEPQSAEIWLDALEGAISELTIVGCTIQATVEPGGANVRIVGSPQATAGAPGGAWLITIAGNVLGSQRRGIELSHAHRVAISGNTIYDSQELSILARNCQGLAVSGNTFSWRGDDSQTPRDGIRLEDCDGAVLSGLSVQRACAGSEERGASIALLRCRDSAVTTSQVLDPFFRGIELEDCVRCRVCGNGVSDRRSQPKMLEGIRVLGTSQGNVVQGNVVFGALWRAIEAPANGVTVEGNVTA